MSRKRAPKEPASPPPARAGATPEAQPLAAPGLRLADAPHPPPRLVSACLAGLRTRHDGRSKTDPRVLELVRRGEAIPVCPEQLGGLTTPREEAAFADQACTRVQTRSGADVTRQFRRGAEEVARLAQAIGAREAILKERSPSCGVRWVYRRQADGTERLVPGQGITARRLRELGLVVRSEADLGPSGE